MISENPVFAVLVTSGNQALLPAGQNFYDLKVGQLGVFDYDTNKSIDGTKPGENANVYYAVGIGAGASGTAATEIKKSAGNSVKRRGIRATAMVPYVAPVNQKILFTFGNILPTKEYTVKFQIQNQEAYANYGYNLPTKYFPLVGGPEVAATGYADTNDAVKALADYINLDDENILVALMKDGATTVSSANYAAWKATAGNEAKILKLEVEVLPMFAKTYQSVDLKFASYLTTIVVPSIVDFDSTTSFVETQAAVWEQQSARVIKQLEYESGGWEGNPGIYRVSDTTYLASFTSHAVIGVGYDSYAITYENPGMGGGLEYHSSLQTQIYVPQADDATATAVKNLINRMYNGLEVASDATLLAQPVEDGQTAQ